MGDLGGDDLRTVLAKRMPILDSLRDAPKTKPTLTAELDHSRSTIDRAIEELLAVECIEPTATAGRKFRLTIVGSAALETAEAYHRDTDLLGTNVDLFTAIPPDDSIGHAFLAGADVYASDRTPDVAHQPGRNLVEAGTRMVGTAPVVRQEYFEVLLARLSDGDFELELVVESELRAAMEQTHAEEFATLAGTDGVTVYETETSLPYALWVVDGDDDTAGVTIQEGGATLGTIVNDTARAVAWARAAFEQCRADAQRLDVCGDRWRPEQQDS